MKKKQAIFDFGGSGARYSVNDLKSYESVAFSKLNKKIVLDFISKIANENNVDEICISAPGIIDLKTGKIGGQTAIEGWTSINMYEEIKELLNNKETSIYADNDGNCALLGNIEQYQKPIQSAVSIVIGSGIGGAFYSNGAIQRGYRNAMCELGYGRIIGMKDHNVSSLIATKGLCDLVNNKYETNYNGLQIFELYEKNDKKIVEIVDEWFYQMASFVFNVIWWFDPEIIFIGGAVSANKIFQNKLIEFIDNLFSETKNERIAKIVFSPNGNESNLLGAKLLAKQ